MFDATNLIYLGQTRWVADENLAKISNFAKHCVSNITNNESMGKWYVVWEGYEPGICDSWAECEERTKGFPNARFKSFSTREEAIAAFRSNDEDERAVIRAIASGPKQKVNYAAIPEILPGSIAVDGACSGNPGQMEYRCVDVMTGEEIFRKGPFPGATNNIGEFLAIVHALALYSREGKNNPIYTDSKTALAWVRNRHCKTTLTRTAENAYIFDIIHRAEKWLQTHAWGNPIIKWQTDKWGEIPADFGRK